MMRIVTSMPLTHPTPDGRYFRELLARRSSQPGLSRVIDDEIVSKFQRRIALLVLDMCGFTKTTSRYGIIHYLSLIERMEATARPVVEQNAGTVIKRQADNLYAAFSHPQHA